MYAYKKSVFIILIIYFLLIITPLTNATTITSTKIFVNDSNYMIYTNSTINISILKVTNDSLEIINLSGGGKFTNIGENNSSISFFNLIYPYNNVRWNNFLNKKEGISDIIVISPPNDLIEVYYKKIIPKSYGLNIYAIKIKNLLEDKTTRFISIFLLCVFISYTIFWSIYKNKKNRNV